MRTEFTKDEIRQVKRSFARCFLEEDLILRFLNIIVESHPEIAPHFKNTDFVQIKLLLRQGVNCVIMYAEGVFAGEFCLEELRISHNRKHMNINPKYYPYWIQSLIQAISELDPQYTPELGELWREVVTPGVTFLGDGY
jgi:hemoglobin-like flavoprotein